MKFLYLIQCKGDLPDHLAALDNKNLVLLSYKENTKNTDIFSPESTWTSGREQLRQYAIKNSVSYDYYIFLDEDIVFSDFDSEEGFQRLENLLTQHKPFIANPYFEGYPNYIANESSGDLQTTLFFDGLFNCFSKKAIFSGILFPYDCSFDEESWYASQLIIILLSFYFFKDEVILFNSLKIQNSQHSEYPKKNDEATINKVIEYVNKSYNIRKQIKDIHHLKRLSLKQQKPLISVITWDASFRESFHTVDCFGKQDYPKSRYEFIWCEYYNAVNEKLKKSAAKYSNASIVEGNYNHDNEWHLGKTINLGIKKSLGDILVIPDGDIVIEDDFLRKVENIFRKNNEGLVCYFRRWDEPKETSCENSCDINHLSNVCELNNPLNYAGCFAIKKEDFYKIGYFEEHEIFSGQGANGLEQYIRFRNAGLKIMWSDIKVYHPYHEFSGHSEKINPLIIKASKYRNWIRPYMGLEQSWILKVRNNNLHWKANDDTINTYLKDLKTLEEYAENPSSKKSYVKEKLFKLIKKVRKS